MNELVDKWESIGFLFGMNDFGEHLNTTIIEPTKIILPHRL